MSSWLQRIREHDIIKNHLIEVLAAIALVALLAWRILKRG